MLPRSEGAWYKWYRYIKLTFLFYMFILNKVSNAKASSEACCRDKNLLSCRDAVVNPEILDSVNDRSQCHTPNTNTKTTMILEQPWHSYTCNWYQPKNVHKQRNFIHMKQVLASKLCIKQKSVQVIIHRKKVFASQMFICSLYWIHGCWSTKD